jgi:hypothetical protein
VLPLVRRWPRPKRVQVWHTAQIAIRMLMPAGHAAAKGNDGAALRFLASVWGANPRGFLCIAGRLVKLSMRDHSTCNCARRADGGA